MSPPPPPPPPRAGSSLIRWVSTNYVEPLTFVQHALQFGYVVFAFSAALLFGFLKALLVGPVAGVLLILGNIGVILGLFPAHVVWTIYALLKTKRINPALKLALLFALPVLFALWLALSICGSIIIGLGYGFVGPWVATFEAFRQSSEKKKFYHCIVDGTWGTLEGSCTVVRDFTDMCYHSFPVYLKEFRESTSDTQPYSIRLVEIPKCIVVGLLGLIVDIPLYTIIAVIKSPFMLFKGWQRLLHDLISREGPFLETACVPVAGLVILLWPLVVLGSILLSIVSSIFIGLYGSVVVYQERSFKRGVAYVVAAVSVFDEYTNDWLYLREGSILPKPRYRKKKEPHSAELSRRASSIREAKASSSSLEASAMFVPNLAPSRSVREAIQEVTMLQIWGELMKSCELRGKELVDANVLTTADLNEWLKTKGNNQETVGLGLPSYSILHNLLFAIKSGSDGLLLSSGVEVTHLNHPQSRLLEWFFNPVVVLKEQIRVIKLGEDELKYLENLVLFMGNKPSMEARENECAVPQDTVRNAQIQALSRRLVGVTRSISKLPTYRRKYENVVKVLMTYALDREAPSGSHSTRSVVSIEIVPVEV